LIRPRRRAILPTKLPACPRSGIRQPFAELILRGIKTVARLA
jgi:hypothetical protein